MIKPLTYHAVRFMDLERHLRAVLNNTNAKAIAEARAILDKVTNA